MRPKLKERIQPYLEDLRTLKVTNRHVAKALNVSESHLSRLLKVLIVKEVLVPALKPQKRKALVNARKTLRATLAATLSIEDAARQANCSERTIYRYRSCSKNST